MDKQNSRKDGKVKGWVWKREQEENEKGWDRIEIAVAVGSQRDGSTLRD